MRAYVEGPLPDPTARQLKFKRYGAQDIDSLQATPVQSKVASRPGGYSNACRSSQGQDWSWWDEEEEEWGRFLERASGSKKRSVATKIVGKESTASSSSAYARSRADKASFAAGPVLTAKCNGYSRRMQDEEFEGDDYSPPPRASARRYRAADDSPLYVARDRLLRTASPRPRRELEPDDDDVFEENTYVRRRPARRELLRRQESPDADEPQVVEPMGTVETVVVTPRITPASPVVGQRQPAAPYAAAPGQPAPIVVHAPPIHLPAAGCFTQGMPLPPPVPLPRPGMPQWGGCPQALYALMKGAPCPVPYNTDVSTGGSPAAVPYAACVMQQTYSNPGSIQAPSTPPRPISAQPGADLSPRVVVTSMPSPGPSYTAPPFGIGSVQVPAAMPGQAPPGVPGVPPPMPCNMQAPCGFPTATQQPWGPNMSPPGQHLGAPAAPYMSPVPPLQPSPPPPGSMGMCPAPAPSAGAFNFGPSYPACPPTPPTPMCTPPTFNPHPYTQPPTQFPAPPPAPLGMSCTTTTMPCPPTATGAGGFPAPPAPVGPGAPPAPAYPGGFPGTATFGQRPPGEYGYYPSGLPKLYPDFIGTFGPNAVPAGPPTSGHVPQGFEGAPPMEQATGHPTGTRGLQSSSNNGLQETFAGIMGRVMGTDVGGHMV